MELRLPYQGTVLEFDLPLPEKNVTVLGKKDPSPEKGVENLTAEALARPIGKRRLSKIVRPKQKVALLFDDWTRPTPVAKILPVVLDELKGAGLREEEIFFVCANGMHAPDYMTKERLIEKLGRDPFQRYEVISHDAYDYTKLKFLGETKGLKTPLFVNTRVVEADVKVAIGRIAPHGEMGYSGGAKMIMPGVSSIWNIIHHHTGSYPYKGMLNNPLRMDIDECGRMAGLDFIVNAVCNSRNEVVRVFAGDPMDAHRHGVAFGDGSIWGAKISRAADIVIASPGAMDDAYFILSMRCLGSALKAVKPSGTIIVVASCSEGWSKRELLDLGWHPGRDLLDYDYAGLSRLVMSRAWHEPNRQFQALVYYVHHIARTCLTNDVCLVGAKGFDKGDAKKLRMGYYDSIEAAVKDAVKKHGAKARATIVPDSFILPLRRFYRVS